MLGSGHDTPRCAIPRLRALAAMVPSQGRGNHLTTQGGNNYSQHGCPQKSLISPWLAAEFRREGREATCVGGTSFPALVLTPCRNSSCADVRCLPTYPCILGCSNSDGSQILSRRGGEAGALLKWTGVSTQSLQQGPSVGKPFRSSLG